MHTLYAKSTVNIISFQQYNIMKKGLQSPNKIQYYFSLYTLLKNSSTNSSMMPWSGIFPTIPYMAAVPVLAKDGSAWGSGKDGTKVSATCRKPHSYYHQLSPYGFDYVLNPKREKDPKDSTSNLLSGYAVK